MNRPRVTRDVARRMAALSLLACGLCGLVVACGPKPENPDLEIQLPAELPEGLRMRWHHVNGADGYRLVFMRMTGTPVCTVFVDQHEQPAFVIQRDSMPSGLAHGWQMNLEIRAMRHGEPMAPVGLRPLKTP